MKRGTTAVTQWTAHVTFVVLLGKVLNRSIQHIKAEEDIKKRSKVQNCHPFSFYVSQEMEKEMKECEKHMI
jgi:hypothetical protein